MRIWSSEFSSWQFQGVEWGLGEFCAEGRHARIGRGGGGAARKGKSEAKRTTARKGGRVSAQTRAKAHVRESAGAGRGNETAGKTDKVDPAPARRVKDR